jgi:hypothetical protein
MPIKDQNGVDIYDNRNYSAPVHAVIGMAGFSLDKVPNNVTNFPFISLFYIIIFLNFGCGHSCNYATNFDIPAKYADTAKTPLKFCIALAG